ncbi:Hcp family type VI secretion system effector [Enterobacter bugandensis]|uniref:Hcp family type VI secretion system effector n=1 Tax=Enterobacter bugandensis TaxID=881260 RepID=UPI0023B052C8|nr:type VI secretion system tube protein TssD [Enterobacter bugandensis]
MPIPAYMWLKDDGGADIKGAVDVQDREGSIEIVGFSHGLNIPVDSANGKITGKRSHSPMMIEKEFDSSSPYLYKAVATGQTLKSAEIRWYRINHAGQEECYAMQPAHKPTDAKKIYTLARKQILILSKRERFHIAIFFRGKLNAKRFFAVFL